MSEDWERNFRPSHGGIFMERFGPVGEGNPHSEMKVCLVATDREYLVRFLHELSLREDCYYVKYSTRPRDGMYLGRCFLETDADAAMLCQHLKAHPKFFVTLQDDGFFAGFRAG
jgi:hypothetical protein